MLHSQLINNQRGVALIAVLFLLVIMTVIGLAAMSSSTIDQRMSGNVRGMEQRFSAADGGVAMATTIIEKTVAERQVPLAYTSLVVSNQTTFVNELMGVTPNDSVSDNPSTSPDLRTTLDNKTVGVDVDRLHASIVAGGSLEFASGYEGIGAGVAGGGIEILYQDNALATDMASVQTQINSVYRHVVR